MVVQKQLVVHKSWRKAGSRFLVTMNQAFEASMAMCVKEHGENWLFPQLRRDFLHMFHHPNKYRAKLLSMEVWAKNEDGSRGAMVASELG